MASQKTPDPHLKQSNVCLWQEKPILNTNEVFTANQHDDLSSLTTRGHRSRRIMWLDLIVLGWCVGCFAYYYLTRGFIELVMGLLSGQ